MAYKPFSQQMRECHHNGTQYRVDVQGHPGLHALVCDKYKKACSSKVCAAERDAIGAKAGPEVE